MRLRRLGVVVGVATVAAAAATSGFGGSGGGTITAFAGAGSPGFSGDGSPSATSTPASARLTATTPAGKIVIARGDGSGRRILASGRGSSVSPDDSQVAVTDYDLVNYRARNFRLELFASAGGPPTHVIAIACGRVYWSPDSTKLACVSYRGKSERLLVIDSATAATTTLATGVFDTQVSFSPDSAKLAYVQTTSRQYNSSGKLRLIDLATRAITTVRARAAAAPVWGSSAIAFSTVKPRGRHFTFNVAVIQPDGTGFRQLTRFHPTMELYGLLPRAWSADGRRLLGGLVGLDAWTYREAYAIDPIHGGSRLIAHRVSPAALSRDGRYVIGQTGDAETTGLAGSNIVRVPWVRGGRKRILLRHAVEPSFNG